MAAVKAPVHRLDIGTAFDGLTNDEKFYAHYMSKAAWYGTRVILRQVSSEANGIFDFILELHRACSGRWDELGTQCNVSTGDMKTFLEYAATFLSNVGNYYGSGDQKFVPRIPEDALTKLSLCSTKAQTLYEDIHRPMTSTPPYSLGYPSDTAQSAYYPNCKISRDEITLVTVALGKRGMFLENTRLSKLAEDDRTIYEVIQGSIEQGTIDEFILDEDKPSGPVVRVVRGDHSKELIKICDSLKKAADYAANDLQRKFLSEYIESFTTGSLDAYRMSQKTWVKDLSPRIENIFGFVEPYRDPQGVRSEWEGLVAIADPGETALLQRLVEKSDIFIKQLPWVPPLFDQGNKGPFEKSLFEPPDFTSINALAYCSSIIFPGINLPNYNDLRQECGFKNVIIANRMSAESSQTTPSPFIPREESEAFQKHKFTAYYIWVVLHELFGHGTSKLLSEESPGHYNFNIDSPPIDPRTSKPITSWYKLGQTWTSRFEDLSTTVDECRAELVGAYLLDDEKLLELFGITNESEIGAADLVYNLYQQLGVDGLRGLQNFNVDDGNWGQAHSQAHFATLKCLLTDGGGFMRIEADAATNTLLVHVDRDRILSHGKKALGRMLLELHMFRCTADAESCRRYYGHLSRVDGEYLVWRDIVLTKNEPRWKFCQANTFLQDQKVIVKEYDATNEGIIQSWAEREC